MTPLARAEIIASLLNFKLFSETDKANLAAVIKEIEEAEREAYQQGRRDSSEVWHGFQTCKEQFKEGFSAARDKAKKVVEGVTWEGINLAERIGRMEAGK